MMNQRQFAEHIGASQQYVSELLRSGRLVTELVGKRRKIRVEESVQLIEATRGDRDDVAERNAQKRGGGATGDEAFDDASGVRMHRAAAEMRKAAAQADQEEMKAEQMRGDLIPREEVEAALTFVGGAVRGALDLLPDQTAPVVAPVTALDEVHAILQDAARNALEAVGQAITRQRAELAKGAKA